MAFGWSSFSIFNYKTVNYRRQVLFIKLGYHAVAYCLGIHLLNSFIGFISPLEDPEDEDSDGASFLPLKYIDIIQRFRRI